MALKHLLPCSKVLIFVACIVTSKVLVVGATKSFWGDVKTIKPGKISAIGNDVS